MKQGITIQRPLVGLGIVLLAAAAMAPTYGGWPSTQPPPPIIAHVDLERVFNEIDRLDQIQGDLEAKLQKYQEQAEALRAEALRLKQDLDLLVLGTEKYEQAEKVWTAAVLDYRATVAFAEAKHDAMRADARRELFGAITRAAGGFADNNEIDFILANDSQLPIQEGRDLQVVQQLALRRVVYASPRFDVTDDLIDWINKH